MGCLGGMFARLQVPDIGIDIGIAVGFMNVASVSFVTDVAVVADIPFSANLSTAIKSAARMLVGPRCGTPAVDTIRARRAR